MSLTRLRPALSGLRLAAPARRVVLASAVVLVLDIALVGYLSVGGWFGPALAVVGAIFAVLAYRFRHDANLVPVATMIVIAAALQLPGLLATPLTSDDAYRYVWDGRVQLSGVDPYTYTPEAAQLAHLRDPILFPPGEQMLINRPGARTIYPPIAQLYFAAIAFVTPWSWGLAGVKIAAATAAVATTGVLARLLGPRRGWALLYGACPAVMIEAGNAAHLDAVVALVMVGLLWASHRHRHWLAGIWLAVAGGLKLVPLLLIPVLLRRGRWRTSVAGLGGIAVSYVPHVLAVGGLVAGFLPLYLAEEGYDGARRFPLLLFVPEQWRTLVAVLIAVALAGLAWWRSGREPVAVTACWLYGAAFVVAAPIYAWYCLPLVVCVALSGRAEWLVVWPAAYVTFVQPNNEWAQIVAYLVVLAVVGWAALRRRRAAESVRDPRPVSGNGSRR